MFFQFHRLETKPSLCSFRSQTLKYSMILERSTRILCPHLRKLQFCHFRTASVSLPPSEAQAPDIRNTMLYSRTNSSNSAIPSATRWVTASPPSSVTLKFLYTFYSGSSALQRHQPSYRPQADYQTRDRSDSPASITNFPAPFELTRICASFPITAFACCKDSARYVLVNPTTFIPPARAD
jgi:hypothetical protein